MSTAAIIRERIERLAQISAYPWNLTRRVFSPKQAEAEALVLAWMEEAGLSAGRDPAGNLVGRIEGSSPGGPAIVIGGHVDTTRDDSRYVGTLNVLMGIAAASRLVERGLPLRRAVEVVAFVRDGAARFPIPRLGSRAVTGRIDPEMLDMDDDYGVTLRQAMQSHGLDPEGLERAKRSADEIIAYLEVATEAGPLLERSGAPVGVVTALTGSRSLRVTLKGQTVNAATVPMDGRRDALAGTAECILAAERIGSARDRVTVTVVRLDVEAVPAFVVTGTVTFGVSIDGDDAERRATTIELQAAFEEIAARRHLNITVEQSVDPDAARCDPKIVQLFERAIAASGHPVARLAQGLSTDAGNMADLAAIGSLLIRCRGGVGWGPAGAVDVDDIAIGLDVLSSVVATLTSDADAPSYPRT